MIVLDDPDFLNLPPDIGSLFSACAGESVFNLPQWYDAVSRYGLPANVRPLLFASDDSRCGLIFCLDERSRRLSSCINPYTCEHDVLSRGPDARACAQALARDTARQQRGFDSIRLSGLDPHSAAFAALLQGFKDAGFLARSFFAWGTWFEDVEGCSFDAYLARRPSVLQNTWRRKLAALDRETQMAWNILPNGESAERFLADYEAVYAKSWKAAEPFPEFIPALICRMAEMGALRAGVLYANGSPIAAQFWLVWNRRATIFKLAYADDWARYSPGTLLTMRMFEEILSQDNIAQADFGRGDDAYKKLWLSKRRERWGIEAENLRSVLGAMRGARLIAAIARDRFTINTRM